MPRWFPFLLVLLFGIALGIAYGWVIDPVQFVDTTPETLRADYQADYILMVAEIYQSEQDMQFAAQRIAMLGSAPPAQLCAQAAATARDLNFPPADIELIKQLTIAMQAYQPMPTRTTP